MSLSPYSFTGEFYQLFKWGKKSMLHNLVQKIKERLFPNSFYEANITITAIKYINNSISLYLWHITIPLCVFNIKGKILSKKVANQIQWCISSVAQSGPTRCELMDCSTPGFPVYHQLLELIQTHVHRVGDAIQPSHPLSSPSHPALNLSQCQGLFKWVSSSHQVAKVLEFQLQHQSFQWIFSTDFL